MANLEYNGVGYGKNNEDAFVDFYVRAAETRGVDVAKINVLRESYKRKGAKVECYATYCVQDEKDLVGEKTAKPLKSQGRKIKNNKTLAARTTSERNECILAGEITHELEEVVNEWDAEEND